MKKVRVMFKKADFEKHCVPQPRARCDAKEWALTSTTGVAALLLKLPGEGQLAKVHHKCSRLLDGVQLCRQNGGSVQKVASWLYQLLKEENVLVRPVV